MDEWRFVSLFILVIQIMIAVELHALMLRPLRTRYVRSWYREPFRFALIDVAAFVALVALLCGFPSLLEINEVLALYAVGIVMIAFVWRDGVKRLNRAAIVRERTRFVCLLLVFPVHWAALATVYFVISWSFLYWLQTWEGIEPTVPGYYPAVAAYALAMAVIFIRLYLKSIRRESLRTRRDQQQDARSSRLAASLDERAASSLMPHSNPLAP